VDIWTLRNPPDAQVASLFQAFEFLAWITWRRDAVLHGFGVV
jgi:hypothetical protein